MTMQGDFENLLEDDGLKHINTQFQRRSERQGRTLEFKDSNLRPDAKMKTETMRLQDATPKPRQHRFDKTEDRIRF